MVDVLKGVSFAVGILFTLGYFYQIVYMVVGLLKEPKLYEETKKHRYGVLISARNESAVIAQLIESIKHQKYPQELIDVFVVAVLFNRVNYLFYIGISLTITISS